MMDRIRESFRATRAFCLVVPVAAAMVGCGSMDSGKKAEPRPGLLALRITEIHYHPLDEGGDPGDEFEFIEIKNTGHTTLSLDKVAFTDGIDYAFPVGATLDAGEYLVLAADAGQFESRYDFEPFGSYTGKLNNAGEKVELTDVPSGTAITSVEYADRDPWPVQADSSGFSLVTAAADPGPGTGYRSSFAIHGSPGADDPPVALINEVLTHTDPPDQDAIELFNPNPEPLNVSGWYLSDKRDQPAKFRIPAGTIIPASGFAVFEADEFNADSAGFSLSEHGDNVYLSADSLGCAVAFCHGFSFGEIENGVALGRYVTSNGVEFLAAQKEPSLGSANPGPRSGPIIISEVMYHPANNRDEYLELANIGETSVAMFDKDFSANTWKISGLGFKFPGGVTLEAGEAVLIISDTISESAFRTALMVPVSVRIFKKTGELSNMSDTLELLKPEEPFIDSGGAVPDPKVPFMLMEKMLYTDESPWPEGVDGDGKSLHRADTEGFASDPASWSAAAPSPGKFP